MVADTFGGMIVERDENAFAFQLLQQFFRMGNQIAIPRIARPTKIPAKATTGGGVLPVPVHVHHQNIKRKIVLGVLPHDAFKVV